MNFCYLLFIAFCVTSLSIKRVLSKRKRLLSASQPEDPELAKFLGDYGFGDPEVTGQTYPTPQAGAYTSIERNIDEDIHSYLTPSFTAEKVIADSIRQWISSNDKRSKLLVQLCATIAPNNGLTENDGIQNVAERLLKIESILSACQSQCLECDKAVALYFVGRLKPLYTDMAKELFDRVNSWSDA